MTLARLYLAISTVAAALSFSVPAVAHPHVWVTMTTEVVYAPDGTVTGIRQAWAFDDMFSAFATQGYESKVKGQFTREELEPLAKALKRSVMLERVALAPSAALDHGDSFGLADGQGGKTTLGQSLVHR